MQFLQIFNKIEDEIHFLIDCPVYNDERNRLFIDCDINPLSARYFDSAVLFSSLLSSRNRRHLDALGRYAHDCFKKRRGLLYP